MAADDRYEGGAVDDAGEGALFIEGDASTGGISALFLSRLNQDMLKDGDFLVTWTYELKVTVSEEATLRRNAVWNSPLEMAGSV